MVDQLEPGLHREVFLLVEVKPGLLNLLKSPGSPLQPHNNGLG